MASIVSEFTSNSPLSPLPPDVERIYRTLPVGFLSLHPPFPLDQSGSGDFFPFLRSHAIDSSGIPPPSLSNFITSQWCVLFISEFRILPHFPVSLPSPTSLAYGVHLRRATSHFFLPQYLGQARSVVLILQSGPRVSFLRL